MKTVGRSNRFYPPKDGNQQQTVGNKKIPSLPESEIDRYKKKKSRKLSRETAYYQERKHREIKDEVVLISYNVRGLNSVGKQEALHKVI